ncbi:helicase SNF2 family protein [Burkholderia pseudomallei]|uniref:DISARM system SNF2-like helicase DrmD n=1 Tax=Burkholderia pseudomallei TaxID=28450 RepID=UPI000F080952|nr:DISARM system SNF2-like helicase DrmD [Burkholderia pseudomallei]VBT21728.1 helicase SNF2 family protein [Burkholderia pseudomallei]
MTIVEFGGAPVSGQLVSVRNRRYVVTAVAAGSLAESGNRQNLVSLSCVEDDAAGEELRVIWELEPGASILERASMPNVSGFDEPERLDAFLNAVRWGAVAQGDTRILQAPFRSGVEIEDYQLDPLARAIQMPRVNLLIADDVGLGKTIESGLVIQEMMLRHRARTVLVVCPSGIQIQWRDQMRDKFGLDFRIVDSELMKELRRTRGLHVNPWTHFPRLITSIDFLKRERPLRLMREALPAPGQPIYPRRFDLLVVDEAHNVAPAGTGRYATDSQRTAAIRLLTPHFEHKLFLSATPHNGYSESFSSLLELLDNQRFARSVRPNPEQLAAVMVRRLKRELPPRWDGTPRYPERLIEPLEVPYTDAERSAHKALSRYAELRTPTAQHDAERFASEFVMKLLKKRLFSSPEAFRLTLEKHLESLDKARRPASRTQQPVVGILRRQVEALDEDVADESELDFATDEAADSAVALFSPLTAEEEQLLAGLRSWATDAAMRPDAKATEMISWLKSTLLSDGNWNDERVIIFTEYRATQKWLQGLLAFHGFSGEDRVMTMYGGMHSEDRERVKAAFQTSPKKSSVRILLATDSASEGIDLQNYCSRLIHYEIPWNPNRMEQRNGRIDRHGQRQPQVMIYHFVGRGYRQNVQGAVGASPGDLEGDLEFLMRAAQKVENIREDLGKVGPVISAQVTEAMLGRRKHLNTEQAERDSEASRKLLRARHDLRAQLQQLHEQLSETKRELHLDAESIQSVVTVGLSLAGQPPLQETTLDGVWPDPTGKRTRCPVFLLPHLTGAWSLATEGLRHPHTQEIRPIVFDHTLASGRDDVVLAHLNHRLVQNCLQRLRAEIWSVAGQHRLHRVTARVIPNRMSDVPIVVAHGRLVVLGGDNKRIHEEIIFAGGELREGRFARIPQVGRLEQLLNEATSQCPTASLQQRLITLWPTHEDGVLRALEARMKDRTETLQSRLDERADREITAMRAVLSELQASIRSQLHEVKPQLELFSTPEKDQFERDRSALERRLDELPEEMEQEGKIILARYAEPNPRLFPVSVTYLVPEFLARQGAA